jgi:dTMP kinase
MVIKMRKKGFFICLEGLDKSGKTLQSTLLVKELAKKGYKSAYTTEPSSKEIGRFIHKYILQKNARRSVVVEALLFASDRVEHTDNTIKPMLDEGKIVVSDRYLFSSLAYQGAAGLNLKWIRKINKYALKPDLTIYIDIPVEVVFKRMKRNRSVMENLEIQIKVKEIYSHLVKKGEMIPINGNRSIKIVSKEITELSLKKMEELYSA